MIKAYIMDIRKLSKPEIFQKYYRDMPVVRQKKIDMLQHKEDKMRSLAASIVLLQGLLDFGMKKEQIEQLIFFYNQYGKPYLKYQNNMRSVSKVQFSLSHAGNYAIACLGEKELGIDMEQVGRKGKKIAARFFTEKEQAYLENIAERQQWEEEFIRIWTRKESFVKAIGKGLSFGLSNVETIAEENGTVLIHKQYPFWNFYEYKLEGYWITICSQEKDVYKKLIWQQ